MISDDDRLAADLAAEAGRRLLALRRGGGDPDALRRAGDRRSHEFLAAELARLRPGDAVLSEEGADDPARLSARRVWIVDPLDGTREFGEPGRSDWAVHVALWERRRADRGRGGAARPRTRFCARRPAPAAAARPLAARHRSALAGQPDQAAGVHDAAGRQTGAELVPLGSAGAKAAAVICGDAEAYVHSGGQYEWDSAAPVAVAWRPGCTRPGSTAPSCSYNQAVPSVPDILICQAALADTLLEAISSVR